MEIGIRDFWVLPITLQLLVPFLFLLTLRIRVFFFFFFFLKHYFKSFVSRLITCHNLDHLL
jgi:hypothetical protein